jgi:hypothetical protein
MLEELVLLETVDDQAARRGLTRPTFSRLDGQFDV